MIKTRRVGQGKLPTKKKTQQIEFRDRVQWYSPLICRRREEESVCQKKKRDGKESEKAGRVRSCNKEHPNERRRRYRWLLQQQQQQQSCTALHCTCTCTLLGLCAATIPQSHFSGHLLRPPGQWHLLPLPFLAGWLAGIFYLFLVSFQ